MSLCLCSNGFCLNLIQLFNFFENERNVKIVDNLQGYQILPIRFDLVTKLLLPKQDMKKGNQNGYLLTRTCVEFVVFN